MSTPSPSQAPAPDRRLATLEHLLAIGTTDLATALNEASDLLTQALGADKVDIFLYEASRRSLIAWGTSHTPMGARQHAIGMNHLPLANGGRTVEVFETGQAFMSGRAHEDPNELRGITEGLGVRSSLLASFTATEDRQGVLAVVSGTPDLWSEEDLRFVEAAASWVGLLVRHTALADQLARQAHEQARRAAADELIAIVAHELRNYVSPIRGWVQLLRPWADARGQPRPARHLQQLSVSVDRLARVLNDLLDSARLDEGLLRLELEPVDLTAFATDIARTMSSSDKPVYVASAEAGVYVNADPARLHQVLQNLIGNAVKFSPKGASVKVEVGNERHADEECGVLRVVDRGPGIPTEIQSRIFERFARGTESSGLGLGLYLARRIAEAHGGTLTVQSEPGQGSTFTLALPIQPIAP